MVTQNFNPGDLVQVKSGGPKMVVESVHTEFDGSYKYDCTWFSGAKHNCKRFSQEALQIFSEED